MLICIAVICFLALIKWVLYTGLIWGMIKIQKLNYNVLGLLGSTALAILLNFVPIVGCYLSWAVLVLCLWKVTRAAIAPDVIFTVAIPSAIMFVLNLWVFAGAIVLMANVLPAGDLVCDEDAPPRTEENVEVPEPPPAVAKQTPGNTPKTNPISVVQKAASSVASVATPILSRTQATNFVDYEITLKGVVMNPTQSSAMISVNNKVYTIVQGETLNVPTSKGRINVRCTSVENSTVSLTVNDSQEQTLRVY